MGSDPPSESRRHRARSLSPTPRGSTKVSVNWTTIAWAVGCLGLGVGTGGGATTLGVGSAGSDRMDKMEAKMERAHEKQAVEHRALAETVSDLRRHDAEVDARQSARESHITEKLEDIQRRLGRIEESVGRRR